MYPDNLRYTEEHEWILLEGPQATVGVTFFAQKELGDVVYVELPEVGKALKKGDEFGTVESVKAVSELYCPVDGEVVEINKDLEARPETINEDPYGRGWMLKLKVANPGDAASLMDAAAYRKHVGAQGA